MNAARETKYVPDFSDLENLEDLSATSSKPTQEGERFPCDRCAGTGKYRGPRIHQTETRCFACNGRGYFKTSRAHREKARQQRADRKRQRLLADIQATIDANPQTIAFLRDVAEWNDFAADLLRGLARYGSMSDKQLAAAERMKAKIEAKRAEKAKVDETRPKVDLSPIKEVLERAKANGLRKPALYIGRLRLSMAPAAGKNPGAVYIKAEGEYAGKITPDGTPRLTHNARLAGDDVEDMLARIAADPAGAIRELGRETGRCCCCGRELTDPSSIEAGIGPICEGKFLG